MGTSLWRSSHVIMCHPFYTFSSCQRFRGPARTRNRSPGTQRSPLRAGTNLYIRPTIGLALRCRQWRAVTQLTIRSEGYHFEFSSWRRCWSRWRVPLPPRLLTSLHHQQVFITNGVILGRQGCAFLDAVETHPHCKTPPAAVGAVPNPQS